MNVLDEVIGRIRGLDEGAMKEARAREDRLTKPPRSLGRLEEIAARIAGITGRLDPPLADRAVIVFAGDHGVAEEGVSAFPQSVTAEMISNFLRGGAGINVIARLNRTEVFVADVGVASDLAPAPRLLDLKVAGGTRNLARGPAMSRTEAVRAVEAGITAFERVRDEVGIDLYAAGEMGIANTTPASALTAALTGALPSDVAGRGTGIDDGGLERKIAVIEKALSRIGPDMDPLDIAAEVGGFEILAIAGSYLAAGAAGLPAVVDGFISGAGALVATALAPNLRDRLIAGHLSRERGHVIALEAMGLEPVIRLDMALGEGTGAVLSFGIIEAAVATLNEMATFADAGVSEKK